MAPPLPLLLVVLTAARGQPPGQIADRAEVAELLGVDDRVDLLDLASLDLERDHVDELALVVDVDHARLAVHLDHAGLDDSQPRGDSREAVERLCRADAAMDRSRQGGPHAAAIAAPSP